MTNGSSKEDFERAKAVLRGESYDTSVPGVRKVLGIVFSFDGSNSWINRDALELRWVGENRRRRHKYFLDLAPGVVWDVMLRMGVFEIRRPTVGHLDRARARVRPLVGDKDDHVAWVVPGEDEIQIMVRPLAGRTPPEAMSVPDSGPWKLPDPLPPWTPADQVYVEFADGLECRRCGRIGESYRELHDGFLICGSCGCSFQP